MVAHSLTYRLTATGCKRLPLEAMNCFFFEVLQSDTSCILVRVLIGQHVTCFAFSIFFEHSAFCSCRAQTTSYTTNMLPVL